MRPEFEKLQGFQHKHCRRVTSCRVCHLLLLSTKSRLPLLAVSSDAAAHAPINHRKSKMTHQLPGRHLLLLSTKSRLPLLAVSNDAERIAVAP